jgi:hypothetical protein
VRTGDRETIPNVYEAVRDAAAITDPAGDDQRVATFLVAFEDDDRPATAVEDLRGELLGTARGIDDEDPAALATAAAAAWLATNPGQANEDQVLREGTRLVFEGSPPGPLADWLAARGVEV